MILLIETSHRICSVAVCDLEGTCLWEKQDDRILKHAEALPILVKEAVDTFADIKAGSFLNFIDIDGSGLREIYAK